MAIMPKALKTDPIVLQAQLDRNTSYDDFSAMVRAQSIQMVHTERPAGRGGLHQLEDGATKRPGAMSVSDLLAAITHMRATEAEGPGDEPDEPHEHGPPAIVDELIAALGSGRDPQDW